MLPHTRPTGPRADDARRHLPTRATAYATLTVCAMLAGIVGTGVGTAAAQPSGDATATVETDPVYGTGDAADDPAVWYDADDPSHSAVIGNDKQGAIEVYGLDGKRIQRIADGFYGNVDVRRGVDTGTGTVDLVVAWHDGIRAFSIDPRTRKLTNITEGGNAIGVPSGGEGLCLYRSPTSYKLYAFVNARNGVVAQYELNDADHDGKIGGTLRRKWDVGTETEGCVADDGLGHFYISEEGVGIWKYGAEPSAGTGSSSRTLVDGIRAKGGHIRPDAEGLTIVYQPNGKGYLMVSSQAASDTLNSYIVYERQGGNDYVREFRVVGGSAADGCGRTDGIDSLAADLGPGFRHGIFICQDNNNTSPASGRQNFKFVPLERVVDVV